MFCLGSFRSLVLTALGVLALGNCTAHAQSSSSSSSSQVSSSQSLSLSLTTSTSTFTTAVRSGGSSVLLTTTVATTFNVTATPTPTSSGPASSSSAQTSATPAPIVLDTRVDPAFGVLGAILVLTGLPSAFWGHKNRWTSFFLIGFYTLSLVCLVLILKFGVLPAVNPPNKALRGYFVLASSIAGFAGGALAIFFWKGAKYFIGAWGGFALALWIQCFHNGGVIKAMAFRWVFYIACAVVGFTLCTIPKIHYHILLVSTAFVGSSAFMLGVDCFTTAGLKEFYVWNIGLGGLFVKYTSNGIQFPVSQTMQIELGLIGAVAVMGIAVQLRILKILQRKLDEIQEEQKKRDEEAELQATDRFNGIMREQDEWEREHPTLGKHMRKASHFSSMPLMKDQETPGTPGSADKSFTLTDGRPRYHSGVSDFFAAPTPEEEYRRGLRSQSPGALPALDLGSGIKEDVPENYIANEDSLSKTVQDLEEIKKKTGLLAEIHELRRSIDALKSDTPDPSSTDDSRHPSMGSRRASMDAATTLLAGPSHLRPPREVDPRGRVHSMDMTNLAGLSMLGESISRPTSAPLRDNDWDAYLHDRKLVLPPSGISTPIISSSTPGVQRLSVSPAVVGALDNRKRRESSLGLGHQSDPSDDIPLAKVASHHKRTSSGGGNIPVSILPPKKASIASPSPQRPTSSRTRTFEELNERHREKLHDLQAPLTQAEIEHAELQAAKQRWERSKALEKEAVTKRQAEKAAMQEQRLKRTDGEPRRSRSPNAAQVPRRHSRSLSGDRLAQVGSSAKRVSMMKVEGWQKYQQQDPETGVRQERGHGSSRAADPRTSRPGVPFPDSNKHQKAR